ncbi:DUF2339 domain-containing protein [Paenibacillus sacheonensis]|uniref:DUF2339 domain-containing protein n=1 Tax=Paenibacillus sacheonensis TaxID=742054 RepID=A0A7X4YS05_9BACL|nr:DUF2339 domain-containing protein [Paenibacillus sacheonensis]MBM7566875.1 putative membrane protein [Paenibacillus sacheonensis]NBC71497.1 DUF2339 domain-containing protein [Paenibacillus sacheonensis]
MNELWKRHWTTLIGVLFLLAALATLFKYTVEQDLITVPMKLGFGMLFGAAAGMSGLAFAKRAERRLAGEILLGLGAAVWYMTSAYAGVYEAIWEPLTVFIVMTAITVGITLYAYRFDYRLLLGLGLGGALLAPLVLRPDADHVFPLFLYLLVVNAAYFAIGVAKSWLEPRIGAFAATWLLYAVYYMQFTHLDSGWFTMPMSYASAAFVFYALAFFVSAWREKCGFAGWNLYASFANTVIFCLWAPALLGSRLSMTLLFAAIGILYLAMSEIVIKFGKQMKTAFWSHLLFGAFMLLIGLAEIGGGSEYHPVIGVYVWSLVAALIGIAGMKLRSDLLKLAASMIWLFTGTYWFGTTWDVPRMDWFAVYVPFLNGGAVAWMLLAAIGFCFSRMFRYKSLHREADNMLLGHMYAILSHLVVGGLLTVQLTNAADEYDWHMGTGLLLSVAWAVYALLLYLWGAYSRGRLFRWFGSAVLVIVAFKAMLFDLSGEDTFYKIIAFALLGAICFGITGVNQRWRDRELAGAAQQHPQPNLAELSERPEFDGEAQSQDQAHSQTRDQSPD